MKLEVGMYVRTDDGYIGKYLGNYKENQKWLYYFDNSIITEYDCECGIYKSDCLCEVEMDEQIVKLSYDLIDLIEIGDYVNGCKITDLEDIKGWYKLFEKNVKEILTHEQYEANIYKVGNKDE